MLSMKAYSKIGPFELYTQKPNTVNKKGYLYISELEFDVPNANRKRKVRVYLPSEYDFNNPEKRFAVIYMMDGKNLFDDYTSYAGEWHVDETIERRIRRHKESCIVVGIDSAIKDIDRTMEMTPESDHLSYYDDEQVLGYAEDLADSIINFLKPLIDETFFTLSDDLNTAVGGSSMGGLMAFYMGMKYKDVIGYSLCFSPAFLMYQREYFKKSLSKHNFNHEEFGRFCFYCGGQEFERRFEELTFYTFKYLRRKGFKKDQLRLIYDSNMLHNEYAWSKYFPEALSYWLDE